MFVEDGRVGAIAEGAGTIGLELTELAQPLDAVFVPVGNGALVNGVGTWMRHASPRTRVIGVCAELAPAMERSWRAHRPVDAPANTIADGIGVRVPVPEAVEAMAGTVDDVVLVGEDEMRAAMQHVFADAGLVIEPAAPAGIAAIAAHASAFKGMRIAAILTGGNLTPEQVRDWLYQVTPRSRSAR